MNRKRTKQSKIVQKVGTRKKNNKNNLPGGSEGTGQSNQENGLVLGKVGQVVLVGRESKMQIDARQLISHGSKTTKRCRWSDEESSRESPSYRKKRHPLWLETRMKEGYMVVLCIGMC